MPSLKTNVILNYVNTLTGIIFPVVTFPYAARILLPDGIGVINFLQSIVAYIVLFTSLGIPMYAVREVAKYRDDVRIRNRTTVEVLALSVALCLAGYLLVWALGACVPQINGRSDVFYVLSLTILFTALGVNWFYQAIEDFRFITIRAVVFRLLAAAALFLFVRDKGDLLIYAFVLVGSTVGNNLINFIHLRKYIPFRTIEWGRLRIWRHLGPSSRIFIFNLITSIYLNLNTVMLGFMSGDESVGLYTAGNKLSHVILSVVTSLGVVMLPRCANLVKTGQKEAFAGITGKSYRFVIALSFPCVVGLIVLADPIIRIFCGDGFMAATSVLRWTAPVIVFIGLTNVIGIQVLYPLGKENLVIWSVSGGALFNLVLNLLLIPPYGEMGAAISTFAAELAVLLIQLFWGRKLIPFPAFRREYVGYVLASVIMGAVVAFPVPFMTNVWVSLVTRVMVGALVYAGILYARKDALLLETLDYIRQRIKR